MKHLRNLLLISVPALTLTLLCMEAILRLGGYHPYYLDGKAFIPSKNTEIIWELRPGFHGLFAAVQIAINSQGFRGTELAQWDSASRFRVLVLGDSVAFGQGVPEGATLAEAVVARLEKNVGSHGEAVNLGIPGYDTCQEYWTFKERGIPLKPNVVLLIYVENDTDPPVYQVIGDTIVSPDVRTGVFGSLMAAARKHFYVYNFVWTRFQLLKQPRLSIAGYHDVLMQKFNDRNVGWKRSKGCLSDITALARANSIRLIVVPNPVLSGRGVAENPYPFADYIETVCGAVWADGAECLDVVPLLRKPGLRLRVSKLDPHPSAEVFMRIAGRVASILKEPPPLQTAMSPSGPSDLKPQRD